MLKIREIVSYFNARNYKILEGKLTDDALLITGPRAISEAKEFHISFISKKIEADFNKIVAKTESKIILVEKGIINPEEENSLPEQITFILTDSPKHDLIEFCNKYFLVIKPNKDLRIHPSACLGDNIKLGESSIIKPNVTIEDGVIIGENCLIGAGTVIKSKTIIHDNVIIGCCNVIGGDGFGYVKNNYNGSYEQFPHFGGVIIENNVHIGNNNCIDRGSLKDTIIKSGVKIDNLVHIAHNVEIGENSLIIACSMIAGSVIIGKNTWISPSSTIRNAITIGENSLIGLGSTVTKSVSNNQTVLGNPALPKKDFLNLRKAQNIMLKSYEDKNYHSE